MGAFLVDGKLQGLGSEGESLEWTPADGAVIQFVELEDRSVVAVIERLDNAAEKKTLVKLDCWGRCVWAIAPRRSGDTYVSVQIRGGTLQANTWSCHLDTIETETGRIVDSQFVK